MNNAPHIHGDTLVYMFPGRMRRDIALHVLNTTYVIFIGIIFTSIFRFSSDPDVRIVIVPLSLPPAAIIFSSSILLYLMLLWLCDNFYMAIPQHISDLLLTCGVLRIALFGCCFIISLNDGPEKFLIFGAAALLEGIVYYFLYADLLRPLYSDSATKWLRNNTVGTPAVVIQMAQEGLKTPKICAFVIAAVRTLLAIGILITSLPLLSGDRGSIYTTLFCVFSYILIQFFLWAAVFRRDLLNKYVRLFSAYEAYCIQQKRKDSPDGTD